MRDRGDTRTLDLLAWEAPQVVPQIDAYSMKAGTLRVRIARAVALVLRECELPREEIVKRMCGFLDEEVSLAMLNAYASQAREEHTISAIRLVALAHATGDVRALQALIEPLDHAIIPTRFLPAIEAELTAEQADAFAQRAEELKQQAAAARRAWKRTAK
jgi:hypothetical protein